MVGLKEFRGLFQPEQFFGSLIHGGGAWSSMWQGDHVSLGPCYSECQAPGLELPSSRIIKIRAVGIGWGKSGGRGMALGVQQSDGQSGVLEGASSCSWKRSLIRSG